MGEVKRSTIPHQVSGRFNVDIPVDLLLSIKLKCVERGITMKKWFLDIAQKDMNMQPAERLRTASENVLQGLADIIDREYLK